MMLSKNEEKNISSIQLTAIPAYITVQNISLQFVGSNYIEL